ncbi:MAG: tRNA (guanosine(37)-N1)-methyltransferase TrmD [Shewanellaceae bacterium]|nr:tRNA (guanosine(37)-N1)-methyltransferase TrmD [Shewanellaceae bacterium]
MWFGVITLFPEMLSAISNYGITSSALKKQLLTLKTWNPRDFVYDKHRVIDDRPFGGGPGMLMKAEPLRDAIIAAKEAAGEGAKVIYVSPQGKQLTHAGVQTLAQHSKLILVCGRYEGIDERVVQHYVDEEWSIGDYVLSGGELPAMVLIDAIARLQPGVLGHADSAQQDSFVDGLLDCPHYTRPEQFESKTVPEVLLSGHHQQIEQWRLKQSLGRTWLKRPDLLKNLALTDEQQALLSAFQAEHAASGSLSSMEKINE